MHVGKRLAYLRRRKGLSQEGVANGVISRGHYSNIEAGRYKALDDILLSLSNVLDVPAQYLTQSETSNCTLKSHLSQFENLLVENKLNEAEVKYKLIKTEFPYIYSMHQEIYFYILECYYYLKLEEFEKCKTIIEENINFYISNWEQLPEWLHFIYHNVMGSWFYMISIYGISEEHFQLALSKTDDIIKKARIYHNLSLISHAKYQSHQALIYAKRSLEIFMNEHQWIQVTYVYILLGVIHWENEVFDEAEIYLNKGLDLAKSHGFSHLEGKIYHNLGLVYDSNKEHEKSIKYLFLSVEKKIAEKSDSISLTYTVLLGILISLNRISMAMEVINTAKSFVENEEDYFLLKTIDAKIHAAKNEWKEYEEIMEKLISYFEENNKWIEVKILSEEYSEYLANRYKYKDAFYYSKATLNAYNKLIQRGG